MIVQLAALAFMLLLTAIGVVCVRRNLNGKHTFAALAEAGIRPPIQLELVGNSVFLVGCGFFLLLVIGSFF